MELDNPSNALVVQQLEELRKKNRKYEFFVLGSMILVIIQPFLANYAHLKTLSIILSILGMCGILFCVAVMVDNKKVFQNLYKNTFLVGMLEDYFTDVVCQWKTGFDKDFVEELGIIQKGNRFHSEDYIKAVYNGVHFEQSDVEIEKETGSGKNHRVVTYFGGRMFEFNFPKTDYKSVMVFSKKFPYMGEGTEPRYEEVKLEGTEFNKKFKVLAANAHDGFYILTPQVMECLEKVLDKYDNVALHYIEGKLYVAINMKTNAFEGDMYKKIVYEKELEKIKYDIEVICDIIDALDLSE